MVLKVSGTNTVYVRVPSTTNCDKCAHGFTTMSILPSDQEQTEGRTPNSNLKDTSSLHTKVDINGLKSGAIHSRETIHKNEGNGPQQSADRNKVAHTAYKLAFFKSKRQNIPTQTQQELNTASKYTNAVLKQTV